MTNNESVTKNKGNICSSNSNSCNTIKLNEIIV
jgi:hypothetical protein